MAVSFRPAARENVGLIIGLAGASGSGKTMSAFRMAQGIVGRDHRFAVIDTEARRALHYAPRPGEEPDFVKTFRFDHAELVSPFRPDAYSDAIKATQAAGYGAIVVDSFSHVWEGEGGVLDWQEECLRESVQRALGRTGEQRSEWQLREAFKRSSWIEPKKAHKAMVHRLLQVRAHLILCLRAEDKIDFVKEGDKTKAVPMQTLSGFKGWIPICDKRLLFELTASFIMIPDKPGFPQPIKLQEQHKAFFPLDQPISEASGQQLATWAKGGASTPARPAAPATGDPRAALLVEIKDTIMRAIPGGSDREKRARQQLLERVFAVKEWAAVEKLTLERLRAAVTATDLATPSPLESACADFAAAAV